MYGLGLFVVVFLSVCLVFLQSCSHIYVVFLFLLYFFSFYLFIYFVYFYGKVVTPSLMQYWTC